MDNIDSNEKILAMPPLAVDTEQGLTRFAASVQAAGTRPARRAAPAFLFVTPAQWLAAAAAVVIVATTLAMTGVADSILQIFETKQFAAVTVTATDLQTLGQLQEFGTLAWSAQPNPHQVPSLAAASAETGLPAFTVTVPASITATAQYGAMPRTTATFVFDASKARANAAAIGRTAPPMPAKLDGSTLVFSGGPAIFVTYGTEKAGSGTLVVGAAKAATVGSDGASVAEIQAYLLSQPSISPALAAQIRAIGDPASTLPVPIPFGQATAKTVKVHGTSGLFVGDSTGLGSGVVWQQNGLVYVVGGTLTEAEALAVANSLQ
ncbi:MAG TPA: hypothetical protein VGS17_12390 [Candidatus Limnocylindria bacterium]|nr:hypothetical protein [Candidatus Limnocylindria bacterium]